MDDPNVCFSCGEDRSICRCVTLTDEEDARRLLFAVRDSIHDVFGIWIDLSQNGPCQASENVEIDNVPVVLIPPKRERKRAHEDSPTTAYTKFAMRREFQFRSFTFQLNVQRSCVFLENQLEMGHAAKILCHELLHIWLRKTAKLFDLAAIDEESLCEMLAYVWLVELREHLLDRTSASTFLHDEDILNRCSLEVARRQIALVEQRSEGVYGTQSLDRWLDRLQHATLTELFDSMIETRRAPEKHASPGSRARLRFANALSTGLDETL